jgi:hypothetical protein
MPSNETACIFIAFAPQAQSPINQTRDGEMEKAGRKYIIFKLTVTQLYYF